MVILILSHCGYIERIGLDKRWSKNHRMATLPWKKSNRTKILVRRCRDDLVQRKGMAWLKEARKIIDIWNWRAAHSNIRTNACRNL